MSTQKYTTTMNCMCCSMDMDMYMCRCHASDVGCEPILRMQERYLDRGAADIQRI